MGTDRAALEIYLKGMELPTWITQLMKPKCSTLTFINSCRYNIPTDTAAYVGDSWLARSMQTWSNLFKGRLNEFIDT